jgi:hypothetical protein
MKKFIVPMLLVLVAGVFTAFVNQNPEADRLMGVWEPSNGRARVKVEKIGAKYYGKFVWLKEPSNLLPVNQKLIRTTQILA